MTPSLRTHEVYPALMMVRGRLSAGQIPAYSRFIAKVSRNHPSMLAEAIRLAALGYHFEKFTRHQQLFQAFKDFLEAELTLFREAVAHPGTNGDTVDSRRQALLARVDSRYRSIPAEFRFAADGLDDVVASFRSAVAGATNGRRSVDYNAAWNDGS